MALARELDDLILHLRSNEANIGLWIFKTSGDSALVEHADKVLEANKSDWLVREITLVSIPCLSIASMARSSVQEPNTPRPPGMS